MDDRSNSCYYKQFLIYSPSQTGYQNASRIQLIVIQIISEDPYVLPIGCGLNYSGNSMFYHSCRRSPFPFPLQPIPLTSKSFTTMARLFAVLAIGAISAANAAPSLRTVSLVDSSDAASANSNSAWTSVFVFISLTCDFKERTFSKQVGHVLRTGRGRVQIHFQGFLWPALLEATLSKNAP